MHIRCLAVSLVTACLIGPPLYAQVQSEPKPHMAGAELPAASAVEDSPWIAKSTREMTAMRDGKTPGRDFTKLFSKSVAQIAMRDGAQIHTEIYAPLAPSGSLPIILVRTPYGLNPDQYGYSALLREYAHLMKDGYIFVFQDTRGRGASTGHFISLGPPRDRSNPSSTDESTDAYDSIDWIVKNVAHNNGRVGMLGISYGGFLTTRALVDPHPALRPASICSGETIGTTMERSGLPTPSIGLR
jgi:predicted acyl esterase